MFCEKGINWHFSLTPELLKKNEIEDKLIFLHIGYVSNINIRESSVALFSDPDVQNILNENFLCIIEDKEDKPESFLLALDLLFLNQDFSYGPMNMFIMPDRRPIVAFSDCNPDNFVNIANSLIAAKREKRDKLEELSETLTITALNTGVITNKQSEIPIDRNLLDMYVESWFDSMFNKGFIYKIKPYTPNPSGLYTVIEYLAGNTRSKYFSKMEEILDHLHYSSLFDPIEGGFFRQAADYSCTVPFYEKTLEENSRFLLLYSAAYKLYGKESYRETAERVFKFIITSLSLSQGGYVNSTTILDPIDKADYYSFSLNELSILFPGNYQEIAENLGISITTDKKRKQIPVRTPDLYQKLTDEHFKLLIARRKEHKGYYRDTRVITASNASAIAAMATASRYLDNPVMCQRALVLFEHIVYHNTDPVNGKLSRYTCGSEAYLPGYLSDYAYFIEASLELHKTLHKEEHLSVAKRYTDLVMTLFYKPENGMFSKSELGLNQETFPFKRESNTDIVKPSANSVMAGNLISMYELTDNRSFLDAAKKQISNIAPNLLSSGPLLSSWAHKILKLIYLDSIKPEED